MAEGFYAEGLAERTIRGAFDAFMEQRGEHGHQHFIPWLLATQGVVAIASELTFESEEAALLFALKYST